MKKYIFDPINIYFIAIFTVSLAVYLFNNKIDLSPSLPLNTSQNETTNIDVPTATQKYPDKIIVDKESSDDSTFKSIKKAILNANAGDTIIVMPGTYEECINISKDLILEGVKKGPTKAIISCNGRFAVNILSENTTLKNLIIKNLSKDKKGQGYGLVISEDAGNVQLLNVDIQAMALNLVQHNGHTKIENSRFLFGKGVVVGRGSFSCNRCEWKENTITGIDLTPKAHEELKFSIQNSSFSNTKGNAIYINKNARGTLKSLTFSNGNNGIYINAAKNIEVKDLSFRNFTYALIADSGAEITAFNLNATNMKKFAVASLGIGSKLTLKDSNFAQNPKVGEASKKGIIYVDNVTYSNNQNKFLTFRDGKVIDVKEKETK